MEQQGFNPKSFSKETFENDTGPRPMLRTHVAEAEMNERDLLLELKQQHPEMTDDVFWKIYEFIKRNSLSKNGGRRKSYRKKSHRKKHRKTMRR